MKRAAPTRDRIIASARFEAATLLRNGEQILVSLVLPTMALVVLSMTPYPDLGQPRIDISLGECLTPRLTENACWELQCDYQRKEEVAIERPKVVTKHQITVYLVHGRVTGHR